MPKLTVEGFRRSTCRTASGSCSRSSRTRGVDILHACGGNARCTTCRVEFIEGEPATDDRRRAAGPGRASGVTGVRLSCQIVCDHDMTVRAISRLDGSGRPDPGPTARAGDHAAAGVDVLVEPNLAFRTLIRRSAGPKGPAQGGTQDPEKRSSGRSAPESVGNRYSLNARSKSKRGAKPQSRARRESSTSAGHVSRMPWRFSSTSQSMSRARETPGARRRGSPRPTG